MTNQGMLITQWYHYWSASRQGEDDIHLIVEMGYDYVKSRGRQLQEAEAIRAMTNSTGHRKDMGQGDRPRDQKKPWAPGSRSGSDRRGPGPPRDTNTYYNFYKSGRCGMKTCMFWHDQKGKGVKGDPVDDNPRAAAFKRSGRKLHAREPAAAAYSMDGEEEEAQAEEPASGGVYTNTRGRVRVGLGLTSRSTKPDITTNHVRTVSQGENSEGEACESSDESQAP